jgi:hypothetical protein
LLIRYSVQLNSLMAKGMYNFRIIMNCQISFVGCL